MGWASRTREKSKQTWGITTLTCHRCATAVARMENCLDHFGLKVAPSSDLDLMIHEVLSRGTQISPFVGIENSPALMVMQFVPRVGSVRP